MKKRPHFGVVFWTAGITTGMIGTPLLYAQNGGPPSTRMILRDDLKNIPGQEVLMFTTDWAPGTRLQLHVHPDGHEFVYVVEGELTFEIDGAGQKTVKAGEALHTLPNVPHFGRNATQRLTKTVVFRVKDINQPIAVDVKR